MSDVITFIDTIGKDISATVAPKIGSLAEEITAQGRHITVTLNGTTIVDASLDDVTDAEMLRTHRDLTKPEGSRGIANAPPARGL